jgi:hypothetical protein
VYLNHLVFQSEKIGQFFQFEEKEEKERSLEKEKEKESGKVGFLQQVRSFSEKEFLGEKEKSKEEAGSGKRFVAEYERKDTIGKGWSESLRFDPNGNKLLNVSKIRKLSELIFSLLKVHCVLLQFSIFSIYQS